MSYHATKFARLAALKLIVSGVIAAVISAVQGYESLLAVSVFVIVLGGGIFLTAGHAFIKKAVETVATSRFRRLLGFTPVLLLTLFLFTHNPSQAILISLGSILLAFWWIGVEFLWLAHPQMEADGQSKHTPTSFLALILAFGFTLIPTRLPSILGGIPMALPFEFIIVAFLLPLAWFLNRSFFSKRLVIILLLLLVIAKSVLYLALPQSGLGVHVFRTDNVSVGERGYTSWLHSPYTEVMEMPYTSVREFPVEWVNDRFGYDFEKFYALLMIDGYVQISDEGRIVFLSKGGKSQSVNTVINTLPAIVVDDYSDLNISLYQELPAGKESQIHVEALYTKFGEARLEPLLLYPDGSYRSLFGNADVWLSKEESLSREQASLFEGIQNLLALLFVAGLVFSLAQGVLGLIRQNQVSEADVYLALTGPTIYFIASLVDKQQVPLVLITFLILAAVVKTFDFKMHPTRPNVKSFIVFAGVLFLLGYLALDVNNLRSIASLPEAQDGLEYQTFARNIFVYGDVILAQTPPRAYKVLFPYLVGLLHVGFGQSAAAQFFMNAWCAVLSAALTFALAKYFRLSWMFALLTSISILIILCLPSSFIYYFRFGLIEPAAVLCLMLTFYFAVTRRKLEMTLAAMLTVLLRLDYLGLALASFLLWSGPVTGSFSSAWASLWSWMARSLKPMLTYALMVVAPPFLIVAAYYVFIPNYMLSASDVSQSSFLSMLDGFMRVLLGGNFNDFREKFTQASFEFLMIVLPLASGFLISMLSIFYRRGIFATIDLRLALLVPSILPAYIAVRPAAYFPRFSFPILALDILLTAMFLHLYLKKYEAVSDK